MINPLRCKRGIAGATAVAMIVGAAAPSLAQTASVPEFVSRPMTEFQENPAQPASDGITFFDVGELDQECANDRRFMNEATGVALATVYYGLAFATYRDDPIAAGQGPWGLASTARYMGETEVPTGSDLLKAAGSDTVSIALDLAISALDADEVEAFAAAVDGLLDRREPVIERLQADQGLAARIVDRLTFGTDAFAQAGPLSETVLADFGLSPMGSPCYQNVYYLYLDVAGQTTYTCHISLDFVYQSFWVRRFAEGTHNLTRDLLEQAALDLAEAGASLPDEPSEPSPGLKG